MRILAIDTATQACSVALFENGRMIGRRHEIIGRGHAERLIPMIAELPERGRAGEIRVSLGPGSFTGTRIGLAAARALAIVWNATVFGFPTLALVACGARREAGAREIDIAMAGGHGEFYVQPYDADGSPLAPHASLAPTEAAARCAHEIVAGDRAREVVELRGWGMAIPLLPDAAWALEMPAALVTDRLSPIYGRPPDARLPG